MRLGPSCSRFSPAPSSESYWKAINRQDREREPHCSTIPRSRRKVGCLWGPISRDYSWVPGTRSPVNQGLQQHVQPWWPRSRWGRRSELQLLNENEVRAFCTNQRGTALASVMRPEVVLPEWDLCQCISGTTVVAEENAGTRSKISVWDGKMFHSHFIKCCK